MRLLIVLLCTFTAGGALAQSCRQEAGPQRSQILVDRCIEVSPATHPPCNAANPCAMITGEIVRSCAMLTGADRPVWCGQYR